MGLGSLKIIIFSLIERYSISFNIPGAAAMVFAGTGIYYLIGTFGLLEPIGLLFSFPTLREFGVYPPIPQTSGFREMFGGSLVYLLIALPFALMVWTGSINVKEAGRLAGDE